MPYSETSDSASELELLVVLSHDDDFGAGCVMKPGYKGVVVPRAALAQAELLGLLSRSRGYALRARVDGQLLPHAWAVDVVSFETRGKCRGVLILRLDPQCDAPPTTLPPVGSVLEIEATSGSS